MQLCEFCAGEAQIHADEFFKFLLVSWIRLVNLNSEFLEGVELLGSYGPTALDVEFGRTGL